MGSRDKSRLSEHAVFQQLIISSDSKSYSFLCCASFWCILIKFKGDSVSLRRGNASLASLRLLWLFVFVFLKQHVVLNDKSHKVKSLFFSYWLFSPHECGPRSELNKCHYAVFACGTRIFNSLAWKPWPVLSVFIYFIYIDVFIMRDGAVTLSDFLPHNYRHQKNSQYIFYLYTFLQLVTEWQCIIYIP